MEPEPPDTEAQPVIPSVDCCHCMLPVLPDKVKLAVPPLPKNKVEALAVPETESGETVIAPVTVLLDEQPLELITSQ